MKTINFNLRRFLIKNYINETYLFFEYDKSKTSRTIYRYIKENICNETHKIDWEPIKINLKYIYKYNMFFPNNDSIQVEQRIFVKLSGIEYVIPVYDI